MTFRLRSLLIAVALLSVMMAGLILPVYRARIQRAVVSDILEAGGTVVYDYQWNNNDQYIGGDIPPGPGWLRPIFGDDYFCSVVDVGFQATYSLGGL